MLPYSSLIPLKRDAKSSIFHQITSSIARLIQQGVLSSGTRLPGTRTMANLLKVNRQTVVVAYDDLYAQGWIDIRPGKGSFVSDKLPVIQPLPVKGPSPLPDSQNHQDALERFPYLQLPSVAPYDCLQLNDGLPDIRLAPLDLLARSYRSIFKSKNLKKYFLYGDAQGSPDLREQLAIHLSETRGLAIGPESVLITRGTIMGLFLLTQLFVQPGDVIAVGETNYKTVELTFQQRGAELVRIPVDEKGLVISALAAVCKKRKIKGIYVASHHHHPTTVTLTAQRRIQLLQLAHKEGFFIAEDDYDFEFHYSSSPILPLASIPDQRCVYYMGSLSKSLAPAFRIGYLIAPPPIIEALTKIRRLIDRQGDTLLEKAISDLFKEGEIQRHLRKSLRTYHARRDHFCHLLSSELSDVFSFQVPDGGLAVWAKSNPGYDLTEIAQKARKKGLYISDSRQYEGENQRLYATRLGFASMNEEELNKAVDILLQSTK